MKCRSFKGGDCPNQPRYRFTISYEGARKFPSIYDFCGECGMRAEEFLSRFELEFQPGEVEWDWEPITT